METLKPLIRGLLVYHKEKNRHCIWLRIWGAETKNRRITLYLRLKECPQEVDTNLNHWRELSHNLLTHLALRNLLLLKKVGLLVVTIRSNSIDSHQRSMQILDPLSNFKEHF